MTFISRPEVSEVKEDIYLHNTQEVKEEPVLSYNCASV